MDLTFPSCLSHTVDIFPAGQLYIVFAAKDAGIPLEDYVVSNWTGRLTVAPELIERELHGLSNTLFSLLSSSTPLKKPGAS